MASDALRQMLFRFSNRQPNTAGYVTHLPEVKAILNELTDHVPALVAEEAVRYNGNEVSVKITIGFTIAKDELS